jgi:hypothetical protein
MALRRRRRSKAARRCKLLSILSGRTLHSVQCPVRDLPPATIDDKSVPAVGHLDNFRLCKVVI